MKAENRASSWSKGLASVIALGLGLAVFACSDDDYHGYPTQDAASRDGTLDSEPPDAEPLPDRITDPDGPDIQIVKPTPNEVVSGNQTKVEARIVDEDSDVDPGSVTAYVTASESHPMGRQAAGSDVYEGIVDISALQDGEQVVVVTATDLLGHTNSAEVRFVRDTGPTVTFFSPEEGERYVNSANLSFEVRDPEGVRADSVEAIIGQTELPVVKTGEDSESPPTWVTYNYNIVFDDSMFNPPLRGSQMIQVTAENMNNTSSESSLTFVIDQDGPTISVLTPTPGEIVGGIMEIEVSVTDEAGVLPSSVVAVLAGDQISRSKVLQQSGATFTASFDTRVFPDTYVFPSLSIRAADTLGNESQVGFLLALDNQPPIVSLDPPEDFRMGRESEQGVVECSWEFDPVGAEAASHEDVVPQVFWMRSRVEDRGNQAPGLANQLVSLVDYSTVKLYLLDLTDLHPLVVDTDGDDYCDEINPDLIPTTSPQTGDDEVLVLNLVPVPPAGQANFAAVEGTNLPVECDAPGADTDSPDELCFNTLMTISLFYTFDVTEPAIYTLEPVDPTSQNFCVGNQFDALANNIAEGWACAAVRAVDRLGNIGVSPPMAICIDYELNDSPLSCYQSTPDVPDCTGTQDPVTLEVTMDPCIFDSEKQEFRSRGVRIEP